MSGKKKTSGARGFRSKSEWTISEFHSWLDGFCAAQEASSADGEWVPNAEQWNLILDIIYKLKSSTIVKRPVAAAPAPEPYYPQPQQPQNPQFTIPDQTGSALETFGGPPGGNPNPAFDPNSFGNDVIPPNFNVNNAIARGDVVSSGKGKVRTPNIDTSKGYASGFD